MEEESFKYNKKTLNSFHCYCSDVEKKTIRDLTTAKDSRSPSQEEYIKQNHKENHFIVDNYINRKTKRGRKEKLSLPKNQQKCGVCLEISTFSREDLISCSICKCLFHLSCYTQLESYKYKENSSYICIRCSHTLKTNININEINCFICGCSIGVLNKNIKTNEFYHQICFNFLIEFKGLNEEDITRELIRKWRYKSSCRFCGEKLSKNKAVIKCKNTKCKHFFHIRCAIEKGMIFDLNYMKKYYNVNNYSDIPFFCSNHNKKISFLYKKFIFNKISENKPLKKNQFYEYNMKNKDKKKKICGNVIFKISKINNNAFKKRETIDNNNNKKDNSYGKENENEKKKEVNIIENIDFYDEKNKNNIFNNDFEKLLKSNNNINIFVDDFQENFQFNKFNNDDICSKDNEENSLFLIN